MCKILCNVPAGCVQAVRLWMDVVFSCVSNRMRALKGHMRSTAGGWREANPLHIHVQLSPKSLSSISIPCFLCASSVPTVFPSPPVSFPLLPPYSDANSKPTVRALSCFSASSPQLFGCASLAWTLDDTDTPLPPLRSVRGPDKLQATAEFCLNILFPPGLGGRKFCSSALLSKLVI